MTREQLVFTATRLHDETGCICDRRYVLSCPKLAAAILSLAERPAGQRDTERP